MLLENKIAVIYGAGGAIGGAVARAFARDGATLFLTGRHRASIETGIPNTKILGVPLVDLDVEQFLLPISIYAKSYFMTARMAARRMVANRSGVIMTVIALHSRTGIPLVGGYGPAMAATEALTRDLSLSSRLTAFAWSVCGRRRCRRHLRSRTPSNLAPRLRA